MTDPDTPVSVPGDTPSGQAPASTASSARDGSSPRPTGESPGPDPHAVKSPGDGSPAEKATENWVTGDEPMTGPQASYLETLAQQAGEEPPAGLTKAQASRAIDDLQARARR